MPEMSGSTAFTSAEFASLASLSASISGPPEIRFLQVCIDYYNEWLDAHAVTGPVPVPATPAGQAILLIYAEAPLIAEGVPAAAIMTNNRVYRSTCGMSAGAAVCNENLHEMRSIVPSFADSNAAMDYIAKHLTDQHVFVLILVGQHRVFIHDPGVDLAEWINKPRIVKIDRAPPAVITSTLVTEHLQTFHIESTEQPGGVAARLMWKVDEKSVELHEQAELRVQSSLLPYLRGAFRHAGAFVDEETKLPGGRVDIRIARMDKSTPPKSVTTMLELKVLYPAKSDASNLGWAMQGIDQAVKYRSFDTDFSFACVFDARRSKADTMPSLGPYADTNNVLLRMYPMGLPPLKKPSGKKTATAVAVKPVFAKKTGAKPAKLAASGAKSQSTG